jgi:hypothetical protein
MCWYRKADLPTLLFIFKGSSIKIYVLNNELNCNTKLETFFWNTYSIFDVQRRVCIQTRVGVARC